jgi:glutathione S-transferase
MYTLYGALGVASLCEHWMLIEIGAPFEYVRLDTANREQRQAWYLQLNPNGVVPTLIVVGEPRYECAALLLMLAERHPEAALAPSPASGASGLYYEWMLHLANTLQPAFRAWFYPIEPAGNANNDAARAAAQVRIEAAWD